MDWTPDLPDDPPSPLAFVSVYCIGLRQISPEHPVERWLYGTFTRDGDEWTLNPDHYLDENRHQTAIRPNRPYTLIDEQWDPTLSATGVAGRMNRPEPSRDRYTFEPCPRCGYAQMTKWRADHLGAALDAVAVTGSVVEVTIQQLVAHHLRARTTRR